MTGRSSPLSPAGRRAALARMRGELFDVLVIGGGVTGSGAALDAATRGLSVALVEGRDFGAGTSSRSSKLIHGGLRYLEQLNFALVREALRERSLLLERLCPHLVKPVPFLLPLTHRIWERFYIGSGVLLYDTMGGRKGLPRHRHLTRRAALRQFPSLRRDTLIGAIQYWDGKVDDARHTMFLARTASHYGAAVANSVKVTGLLREGDSVTGARAVDLETGDQFDIRARRTVNAGGVWTDEIQRMAGGRGQFHVRASKGVHLLVRRDRIRSETGLIARTEKSVLFVIPWSTTHWIIGTTDTEWNLNLTHPSASRSDIDYLLVHVNSHLVDPLGPEDIVGVYAGLRPLLAGESEATSKLSREHAVASPVSGLVTVAGGKYTTYRVMAKDAIDAAVYGLEATVPDSCTEQVPLLGADGYAAAWNRRQDTATRCGLPIGRMEHLLDRYGTLAPELLELMEVDASLGRPIPGAPGYLQVEADYAVTHEGALHLEDILTRRTRISIETGDRGVEAAAAVGELVAPVMGWSELDVRREVRLYQRRVEAELDSQRQADDRAAEAARLEAPEVRNARTEEHAQRDD
jgi:glycerol-3-phosphate dehydrogenase